MVLPDQDSTGYAGKVLQTRQAQEDKPCRVEGLSNLGFAGDIGHFALHTNAGYWLFSWTQVTLGI